MLESAGNARSEDDGDDQQRDVAADNSSISGKLSGNVVLQESSAGCVGSLKSFSDTLRHSLTPSLTSITLPKYHRRGFFGFLKAMWRHAVMQIKSCDSVMEVNKHDA